MVRHTLKVVKLNPGAILPRRAHDLDAGLDLVTPEDIVLQPFERIRVALGISVELPSSTVGLVQARSGLASKLGVETIGNVIDEGYSGEISAILVNLGSEVVNLLKGSRVAQLLVLPVMRPEVEQVDVITAGERGAAGYGSTGMAA